MRTERVVVGGVVRPHDAGGVGPSSRAGAIAAAWARENPRSEALSARARRLLPGGVTHDVRLAEPFPLAVAGAAGSRKWGPGGHELGCDVLGHRSLQAGPIHHAV